MTVRANPVRHVSLASREAIVKYDSGGTAYVRLAQPLGAYPARMTDRLDDWAERTPDRTFIAKRLNGGDWRKISYREMRGMARSVAQALVDRGLSADRPIAILSGNDLEHATLAMGAMYAGIPFSPISPAYSLVSTDFGKLRHIFGLLQPGLIFVSNGVQFSKAIEAAAPNDARLVVTKDPLPGAALFSDLLSTAATSDVDEATRRVGPDTVFKILFTSGSVAKPKGVMNTHRMWCSNQEMIRACWPFLAEEPPVILEWLPWNHTFAGNKDMGLVLYNGGSLYLDGGRPVPGQFEETICNLREIAPTIFLNVPIAFDALVPYLRRDRNLAKHFFSNLKVMFYAAAGLSQRTWDDLEEIALETTGQRVLMLTGLGSTETAPFAMWTGRETARAGEVGLPAPGITLKLAPADGKLEARFKGPSITPGYWRQPELTQAAFDEEGFFKMGDALRYVDESDPARGFLFDGRVAEDFKLATGTWVSVGPLRSAFLEHFTPYAREVVIAGQDRNHVAAMVFPNPEPCRELCADSSASMAAAEFVARPEVRAAFQRLLRTLAAKSTGLSTRIERIVLLDTPPTIDAHELTDKGSISQRAVLHNRAAVVEEMYSDQPSSRVIGL